MARLFLACPLPAETSEQIGEWAAGAFRGTKLVAAQNLHVTIRYFGEDDADFRILETQSIVWTPILVAIHGVARFGRTALGLELLVLKGTSCEALPSNKRSHITVARASAPLRLPPPPELDPFPLDDLVLYESRTMSRSVEYVPLARANRSKP